MTIIQRQIEQAYERQLTYGELKSPTEEIKRFVSYIIEECAEVNRELTAGKHRYKPFKASKPIDEKALAEELADLCIHCFNLLAVSGIHPAIIEQTIEQKLNYNKTRKDHQK